MTTHSPSPKAETPKTPEQGKEQAVVIAATQARLAALRDTLAPESAQA